MIKVYVCGFINGIFETIIAPQNNTHSGRIRIRTTEFKLWRYPLWNRR